MGKSSALSTSNERVKYTIEIIQNSQSIANNTSNVTVKVRFYRTNTGYETYGTGTVYCRINGTLYSASVTSSQRITNSGIDLFAKTLDISHGADGKKTLTCSAWISHDAPLTSSEQSYSQTLTDIPRQANITTAPDFTDEENPTITYSNPAGNTVTTLQACISFTGSKDDIVYRDIPKTGTSYTFNLTEEERKVLRSGTTGKSRDVIFFVRTEIGANTYYSTLTKKLSIVNANPTFTASQITYADTNTKVTAVTGNNQHIVQNQSNLKVTIGNATAKKEASISKYDITVNGVTKTVTASGTVDFGKINTSSNTEIIITVTDSRGNTTTAKKTVTVLAWALPIFTVSLERLNNYEDTTYLMVDASVSSVNSKNTMAISYEYKESGGEYITAKPVTIANKTKYTLLCDKNKAYIFSVTVKDAFDSVPKDFVLSKGKFPLFIDTRKNAVGINDFPAEGEALRVAEGVARFVDGIVLNGGTKSFLITVTDSGTLNIAEYK